jgi:hypothetical protein
MDPSGELTSPTSPSNLQRLQGKQMATTNCTLSVSNASNYIVFRKDSKSKDNPLALKVNRVVLCH